MSVPRPEYPRPQFRREEWLCLNGEWEFEIDHADSGLERGLRDRALSDRIMVPFCPESELSGIGCVDFMNAVWYRREVAIPEAWSGRSVMLHFQAVDYDATVWVNGTEVARHRGGFAPFACDLSGVAAPGETATIVVRARDPRGEPRPGGKQSNNAYHNHGCLYTRTTGIWQSVWMEPVGAAWLERARITPDVAARRFLVEQPMRGDRAGLTYRATLLSGGDEIARAEAPALGDFAAQVALDIPEDRVRLWKPGEGFLYDLVFELIDADGATVDRVESYAGLRSIGIDGKRVLINGESVFQRLVLDQGYYPDGIMTAPSDEALVRDIELSVAVGFNGARLHQKVFEERFLYHADRMGYLVWGEFGDWGFMDSDMGRRTVACPHPHLHQPHAAMLAQWLEVVERDYSHPSIIGWCPINETVYPLEDRLTALDDLTRGMFSATKAMDRTRPVIDTSGYSHRVAESDVWDCHDYAQDPNVLRDHHAKTGENVVFQNPGHDKETWSIPYRGQPFFVSEFGGIRWSPAQAESRESWGYGNAPKTIEEFYERFEALCGVLLENEAMFGYCYTQLTDVFQEQNGLYGFDRSEKFDAERLRKAQIRQAAVERE